jgi:hypothetical protein
MSENTTPARELIDALDADPELTDELRRRILTEELLALPAQMAAGFGAVDARLDRVEGRLNNRDGDKYEDRVAHRAPRMVRRHVDVWYGEIVHRSHRPSADFLRLTEAAVERGAISDNDVDDLDRVDVVLKGRTREGNDAYVVAEISITIHDDDIARALARARIMYDASGAPSHPAVIGSSISYFNRHRAVEQGVSVILFQDTGQD